MVDSLPGGVKGAACDKSIPPSGASGGGIGGGLAGSSKCISLEGSSDGSKESINDALIRANGLKTNHENNKQADSDAPGISVASRVAIAARGGDSAGVANSAARFYSEQLPIGQQAGVNLKRQAQSVNDRASVEPGDYSGAAMGRLVKTLSTPPIAPPGVTPESAAAMGLAGSVADPNGSANAERSALLIGVVGVTNLPANARQTMGADQAKANGEFATKQYLLQAFIQPGSKAFNDMISEMTKLYVNTPVQEELDYVTSCGSNQALYGKPTCTNEYALLKYRLKLQQGTNHILLAIHSQQQERLRLRALEIAKIEEIRTQIQTAADK
jgi:hypothetical protein